MKRHKVWETWGLGRSPVLPLAHGVTLGKSIDLLEPQFLHFQNGLSPPWAGVSAGKMKRAAGSCGGRGITHCLCSTRQKGRAEKHDNDQKQEFCIVVGYFGYVFKINFIS